MDIQTLEIVQTANKLVDTLGTRDPHRIARELSIEVVPVDFKLQRGAYKVLMRNRFIFIKNDLHPVMENIVMLHEIGHDVLHRKEAVKAGGFKEFNIFNMQKSRIEYEANVFASQVSLGDEEILEYIRYGYDIQQIASAMHSDTNLDALKTDALIAQGYCLHHQEYLAHIGTEVSKAAVEQTLLRLLRFCAFYNCSIDIIQKIYHHPSINSNGLISVIICAEFLQACYTVITMWVC